MAGRVAGKVAFVTGAARGQGRSHAIRLAEEGADIIAVDICEDYAPSATAWPPRRTWPRPSRRSRRSTAGSSPSKADVRDPARSRQAVDAGVAELGKLDIVCANAGICTVQSWDEVTPAVWQDTIDTNLTGVWNTMVAATPHLIANGGGSIICHQLDRGHQGPAVPRPVRRGQARRRRHRQVARQRAGQTSIRVNTVHPTGVDTPMVAGLGGLDRMLEQGPGPGPDLHERACRSRSSSRATSATRCSSSPPTRPGT